jgi:hypothetical protein
LTAFCATEGGSDGPTAATGAGAGAPGAATRPGATGWAGGGRVLVWPLRFVTVTLFVTLLMTTVLWMLAWITLLRGGGAM